KPGDRVAVLGAGPIGLVSIMVAKVFGATSTVVTDISGERLLKAKEVNAWAACTISRHRGRVQ
ncbi:unnamed protein product, partial [Discosporangium mesarthrocarpum]